MGYKKSKAFEEIRVPMLFNMADESEKDAAGNCMITKVEVAHVFKIPPPNVREEHRKMQLKIKGTKVGAGHTSDANWMLWKNCIIRVEGYDDLPDSDQWKEYFSDPIGRIHVDNAVDRLMETLGSEEVEQEKKLEPSSAQ